MAWTGGPGSLGRGGLMCFLETVSWPEILKPSQLQPAWTQVRDTLKSSKLPSRPASESSDPNKPDEMNDLSIHRLSFVIVLICMSACACNISDLICAYVLLMRADEWNIRLCSSQIAE